MIDVRSFKGADCDSDHFLVCMGYRARILKRGAGRRPETDGRLYVEKLATPETAANYHRKLIEDLEINNAERCNTETGCTMKEAWKTNKRAITNAEDTTLGPRPKKKRGEWFDQECMEKIERRNISSKIYLERSIRAKRREYEEARKEAKRILRYKRRKYLDMMLSM